MNAKSVLSVAVLAVSLFASVAWAQLPKNARLLPTGRNDCGAVSFKQANTGREKVVLHCRNNVQKVVLWLIYQEESDARTWLYRSDTVSVSKPTRSFEAAPDSLKEYTVNESKMDYMGYYPDIAYVDLLPNDHGAPPKIEVSHCGYEMEEEYCSTYFIVPIN
jgi:hypothetical protein